MKRSQLSRGAPFDENGRQRWSSFKAPRKPLKRTRMKRHAPRRLSKRKAMSPYVAWVKTLPCINCHRPGPSDPAHMTLGPNEKGTALKVDDSQVVPLCNGPHGCHRYFDGNADGPRNPFRGFTKSDRYAHAAKWVERTRLAAIPEDREQAELLEAAGLGSILQQTQGIGWAWLPIGAT